MLVSVARDGSSKSKEMVSLFKFAVVVGFLGLGCCGQSRIITTIAHDGQVEARFGDKGSCRVIPVVIFIISTG